MICVGIWCFHTQFISYNSIQTDMNDLSVFGMCVSECVLCVCAFCSHSGKYVCTKGKSSKKPLYSITGCLNLLFYISFVIFKFSLSGVPILVAFSFPNKASCIYKTFSLRWFILWIGDICVGLLISI